MEVITFKTPPVHKRCTKEQLRALFIKLMSLVRLYLSLIIDFKSMINILNKWFN